MALLKKWENTLLNGHNEDNDALFPSISVSFLFVKENYYEKDSYHIVLGIKGRERKEKMNEISFFFRENEMSKNTVLGSSTKK